MRVLPLPMLQESWALDATYLWLAAMGVVLTLLIGAFAVVLIRRHRDWLGERLGRLDRALAGHAPRPWRFIRGRFSRGAWHGLKLTAALLVCLSMIFLFVEITDAWIDQAALYRIDQAVNRQIQGLLGDQAVRAVALFTDLGSGEMALVLSVVLGLVFIVRKAWWRLLALFVVVGAGSGLLWTLKWTFGRARPVGLLSTPASASFPSGHTFTAVVLYGFLIYLVWRWVDHRVVRLALTGALAAVVLFVGFSRVLLSVHWVTDVLGGFTVGLAWLVFGLVFTRAVQAAADGRPAD